MILYRLGQQITGGIWKQNLSTVLQSKYYVFNSFFIGSLCHTYLLLKELLLTLADVAF